MNKDDTPSMRARLARVCGGIAEVDEGLLRPIHYYRFPSGDIILTENWRPDVNFVQATEVKKALIREGWLFSQRSSYDVVAKVLDAVVSFSHYKKGMFDYYYNNLDQEAEAITKAATRATGWGTEGKGNEQ